MSTDKRVKCDLDALDENGMVVCNPRDREAAHRAEVEGIATANRAAVTCRKCISLLYKEAERPSDETPDGVLRQQLPQAATGQLHPAAHGPCGAPSRSAASW